MWFIGRPVLRLLHGYQWHNQVTDDAQALHAFVVGFFGWLVGRCWGYATLVNFGILEVATGNAVGLESGVVLTHDFSIRGRSTSIHQY